MRAGKKRFFPLRNNDGFCVKKSQPTEGDRNNATETSVVSLNNAQATVSTCFWPFKQSQGRLLEIHTSEIFFLDTSSPLNLQNNDKGYGGAILKSINQQL